MYDENTETTTRPSTDVRAKMIPKSDFLTFLKGSSKSETFSENLDIGKEVLTKAHSNDDLKNIKQDGKKSETHLGKHFVIKALPNGKLEVVLRNPKLHRLRHMAAKLRRLKRVLFSTLF